jgi:hypothetical protein
MNRTIKEATVVCLKAMPNSTFLERRVWMAALL